MKNIIKYILIFLLGVIIGVIPTYFITKNNYKRTIYKSEKIQEETKKEKEIQSQELEEDTTDEEKYIELNLKDKNYTEMTEKEKDNLLSLINGLWMNPDNEEDMSKETYETYMFGGSTIIKILSAGAVCENLNTDSLFNITFNTFMKKDSNEYKITAIEQYETGYEEPKIIEEKINIYINTRDIKNNLIGIYIDGINDSEYEYYIKYYKIDKSWSLYNDFMKEYNF